MAYGLHWEWRGFGKLSDRNRARITQLRSIGNWTRKIRDRYLWYPGCRANVKLRSWGASEGLKFKRLVEEDKELKLQLWLERRDEDYAFPVEPNVVRQLAHVLEIELAQFDLAANSEELVDRLRSVAGQVRTVVVQKSRRTYVWQQGDERVLVDLAEIHSPVATTSVGLENLSGLSESSSRDAIGAARRSVVVARTSLELPAGLETLSYVEALARWVAREG